MKCFYHNDIDGICAGRIVAEFYQNFKIWDYSMCNYTNLDISCVCPDETVFFVDLSFTDATKDALYRLIDIGANICWIDHHESSIALSNSDSRLKNLPGIRSKCASGAALTYMFLNEVSFEDVPLFIQYISDFDNWNHQFYPKSTYFKYGLECNQYDLFSPIWETLFSDCSNGIVNKMITDGEIISQYNKQENFRTCSDFGYIVEFEGYTAYVLNSNKNSLVFGDIIHYYPLVITWIYTGKYYKYSLYSEDNTVDCSKIAERYGGGGHKSAAGFTSSNLCV